MRFAPFLLLGALSLAACKDAPEKAQELRGRLDQTQQKLKDRAARIKDSVQGAPEPAPTPLISRSRPLMGTVFQIRVQADRALGDQAIRKAFDEIARLEDALSEWRDGSEISTINRQAGKGWTKVGDDVLRVIHAGIDVSAWSGGAFDLSWAALRGVYDFRPDSIRIARPAEVKRKLPLINWQRIQVREPTREVRLAKKGMAIGTGGIAKGDALDRAGAILRDSGIDNYMIFGGGQVQVHGLRDGRPWRVGIQHPREAGAYFGALEASDASFSTSGDYEHAYIDSNGRRWHHLIDPKTGLPGTRSISVTVMTERGLYADALSTAAFILGPQAALNMFAQLKFDAELVIVGSDCRVHATPNAWKQLQLTVELVDGKLPNC